MTDLLEQEMREQTSPITTTLPFPPVTPQHILNTSFHSWYPRFRSMTPKARLIPLSQPFLDYLRADGIILPPEHKSSTGDAEDSGYDDEGSDDASADTELDPSESWADVHAAIATTIRDLGGKVVPKLNWSAPKDATWIATTNDMECRTPNDVYLLLKSSDFITHDLEHAFDGCVLSDLAGDALPRVPYHLVLRKAFNLNPSLEFRCFVRQRRVVAISQREMNHFDFLFDLRDRFGRLIRDFVEDRLVAGFPDENFVADVYIPPPHEKVWLIDVNPWAPRTDPLLFSWLELLTLEVPAVEEGKESSQGLPRRETRLEADEDDGREEEFVRLTIQSEATWRAFSEHKHEHEQEQQRELQAPLGTEGDGGDESSAGSEADADVDADADAEIIFVPEFRLVNRDDPEAYQFSATKYSAHKLPKDVVDASLAPGGMKNMMDEWKRVMERQQQESDTDTDSDTDTR
ncbi:cell division cycle protein [Cladophialophora carrionii]|uniref:Cell division cycle protein n=1 Tax=Cladophialophora carrionii TaxID=86049 RepID=A0A1C1CPT9_9EURO|nr:cell division cycle protein [Cladophialophora carrionii]